MINALKTKVTNVSRYFCAFKGRGDFSPSLREKFLTNQEFHYYIRRGFKCGTKDNYIYFKYDFNSTRIEIKRHIYRTAQIRDIESQADMSQPRILRRFGKIDEPVVFKETISLDYEEYTAYPNEYWQTMLDTKRSSKFMKTLILKYDNEICTLDLSKSPNSTQISTHNRKQYNYLFVPITDYLDPYYTIVFFAELEDRIVKYSIIEADSYYCKEDEMKPVDNNYLDVLEKPILLNQIQLRCADYASKFRVNNLLDTCPENPENTVNITVQSRKTKKVINAFLSTWRAFVCYKTVESGNFNDFMVLW